MIHKVTQIVTKGVFLIQCTMKSPISVYKQWFHSFEIGCKQFLMVKLCCVENISIIFQSSALITLVHMHTVYKWGSGITPKTSGSHASLGLTQQSQRPTLSAFSDSTNCFLLSVKG